MTIDPADILGWPWGLGVCAVIMFVVAVLNAIEPETEGIDAWLFIAASPFIGMIVWVLLCIAVFAAIVFSWVWIPYGLTQLYRKRARG